MTVDVVEVYNKAIAEDGYIHGRYRFDVRAGGRLRTLVQQTHTVSAFQVCSLIATRPTII